MQELRAIRIIPGTKITHDRVGKDIKTFPYSECLEKGIPCAIPAMENGLVIIDIDVPSETHKYDGTLWWKSFCLQHPIPATFTVLTKSGGFHLYYRIPEVIRPSFDPPGSLALGVDIKYDGYGVCPPTDGYKVINGHHTEIAMLPPEILAEMEKKKKDIPTTHEVSPELQGMRRDFTEEQIVSLRHMISTMVQPNFALTRDQWRDGIFSIKSGTQGDYQLGLELAKMWTFNQGYVKGDEYEAESIYEKASCEGPIGPGTIFSIINELTRKEGKLTQAQIVGMPLTDIATAGGLLLEFSKDGRPKMELSENNVATIIDKILPKEDLYYDTRMDQYILKGEPVDETYIANTLVPSIQHPTSGLALEKFKKSLIISGIDTLMYQRAVDPHLEWLKGLKWDGVNRLETFFIDYFGVDDTPYHRILGKNFWTSVAARGLSPGCKVDSMLVLEGGEGIKKSTFVEFVGGKYTYVPSESRPFKSLDCIRQMHQAVVVELPELIGLIGESDEMVKAILSQPFDTIRALYARKAIKRKRGFVFIGTTNSRVYLSKGTGSRRFWPLRIPDHLKELNLVAMQVVRDQLFAEGAHLFNSGYEYWEMPKEYRDPEVTKRQHGLSFSRLLNEAIGGAEETTLLQCFTECSKNGLMPKLLNTYAELKIKDALEELGYVEIHEGARTVWRKNIFKREEQPVNILEGLL